MSSPKIPILLKDVPLKCPECDTYIFGSVPTPKISKTSWFIALAGVVSTAVWIAIYLLSAEFYITPAGSYGWIICAFVYGWPFYISAVIIWKKPLAVAAKCSKCKWRYTYKIGTPKL